MFIGPEMIMTIHDDRHGSLRKKTDIMVQIEKNSVPLRGNLVLISQIHDDRHGSSWIMTTVDNP